MSELIQKQVAFLNEAAKSGLEAAKGIAPYEMTQDEVKALSALSPDELKTLADIKSKLSGAGADVSAHFGNNGF